MTAADGDSPDKDQSMDDILASIRRIMLDEQARLQDSPGALAYAAGRAPAASADPVLILDSSMVVEDRSADKFSVSPVRETGIMASTEHDDTSREPQGPVEAEWVSDANDPIRPKAVPTDAVTAESAMPAAREAEGPAQATVPGITGMVAVDAAPARPQIIMSAQAIEALMAPAAAAAAAASVESLLRRLSEERLAATPPSAPQSPTIEAVVREELRPFLKVWLDQHLPSMVERLVRAEITRLIERTGL
jgi:cell pole-organizing protein PopZ